MSRSYRTLALALVGMLVLVGLAKLADRDADSGAATTDSGPGQTTPATDESGTDESTTDGSTTDESVTDEVDGDASTTSTITPPITASCTITKVLEAGTADAEVTCLEQQLIAAGFASAPADATFDTATDAAVRAYQTARSLEVDGVVGRQTAQTMGIWAGPLGPLPATDDDCPDSFHGAIIDRANQRGALCESGAITHEFPLTTAWSQPDPGTYDVYAKDMNASSNFGGHYSTMTHFVAFTKGKYKGARIAFHSVPKLSNGEWVQPLDSVGTEAYHGQSSGCIRVLPEDAVKIWDWLSIGEAVRVIS